MRGSTPFLIIRDFLYGALRGRVKEEGRVFPDITAWRRLKYVGDGSMSPSQRSMVTAFASARYQVFFLLSMPLPVC